VPLLGAAYVVPRLLNVEGYKPALADAVKQATGRELVIEGPLKLTLLPVPRISARKVHFANAVGGTGAQMVEVQWVGASPSWSALLQGRVEVGKLTLYKPVLVLETDADGVPNWEFKPGRRRRAAGGRTERRSASGGRPARHHRRHAELHLPADRQDHQGRAGQGDGLGRFAQGSVLDRRQRDRQRRAAVARDFGPRTKGRRRERCQARGEGPERSSDLRRPGRARSPPMRRSAAASR
jgi:hypothetical protein